VVCRTPFGFPVEPDVYRMNKGSSEPIGSAAEGLRTSGALISCAHHVSRPGSMSTSPEPRRTTMHDSMLGHSNSASSALALSGTLRPPRMPSSAVMSIFAWQSWIRPRSAEELKPPKTIEWIAPIRAQASMAITSSGTIGMYSATRSPFSTPFFFSTLAKRLTS
jgi:hypothetical protein